MISIEAGGACNGLVEFIGYGLDKVFDIAGDYYKVMVLCLLIRIMRITEKLSKGNILNLKEINWYGSRRYL